MPDAPEPGFGLYVHWPFCKAKCPYCDFNSHVRPAIDEAAWREALVRELSHYAADVGGRRLTSIFFGGGTPSLMHPDTVGAVIDAAAGRFALADDIEITLEANPTSAEAANVAGYRAAGVNRVSIGVQALDDPSLRVLGRQHTVAEALAAVRTARRHVPNVSFDLMTARPNQTPEHARDELQRALAEGPSHIAIYQLTIEPGTAFEGAWRRGELPMPDADTAAEIFDATQAALAEAGLPAYEISNHAVPGAECRHNLTYWRYGDYVGIGPGAHGRLTLDGAKVATRQHSAPEAWLARAQQDGHATQARTALSWTARRDELVMMGLRLTEGIARAAFDRELGCDVETALPADALADLRAEGLVRLDATGLAATAAGRQRLNAVLGYLLSGTAAAVG
jgi:oxygen-independent coproporphyrinogen-3 oxidase